MIRKYNEMKTENDSIQDLIIKYKNDLDLYEESSHTLEDCEGMSDISCFDIGETSGRIEILKSVIEELENIIK